ncbi:MAG: glycosyltransferase, partial [Planctomycetaceae bacterium]
MPTAAQVAMPSSTILISGGGTGGHLYPGLAVADVLRDRVDHSGQPRLEIAFVGSRRPIEERILSTQCYPHHRLDIESSRSLRTNPLRFLWKYARAVGAAHQLLAQTQPSVVVGLGGFASVPLLTAANRRRIPTLLLEQNAVPGRATRWLCRRAAKICVAMAAATSALPRRCADHTYVTGNPVRREISNLHQRPVVRDQPTLLVIGGSQGASA